MRFKTEFLGNHITLRKGLSYKGDYLVTESGLGLVGLDAFLTGGGYKRRAEKPYSGTYKLEHLAEPGDVLLAMTEQQDGLLASPLIVPEDLGGYEELVFSHHVAKVVATSGKIKPEFVFNFLRVPINRTRAAYGNTGTTVQDLPYDVIYEQLIPVPSLEEQDRINSFIALLDRKIELNTAMVTTLEKIAQSLFRSWFVDFDPVRAKMIGQKPGGMDDATATLFPDSMQDSALGSIPSGWSAGRFGEFFEISKSSINPQRYQDSTFVHYSIPSFDSGGQPGIVKGREILSSKYQLKESCVLVSKLNPETKRIWTVLEPAASSICSTEFIVLVPKTKSHLPYLHSIVREPSFHTPFASMATGSTGSRQRVRPEEILNIQCMFPNRELVEKFSTVVGPLLRRTKAANDETKSLQAIRESLLPFLISGELRIQEELLVP